MRYMEDLYGLAQPQVSDHSRAMPSHSEEKLSQFVTVGEMLTLLLENVGKSVLYDAATVMLLNNDVLEVIVTTGTQPWQRCIPVQTNDNHVF